MNLHDDVDPDFSQDSLMTTQDGFLYARGVQATTSIDVSQPQQVSLAVKHLFEQAHQRPHPTDKTPIVFGAIPFSHEGKAQFILPRETIHLERQQLAAWLAQNAKPTSVEVESFQYNLEQHQYEAAVEQALLAFEIGHLEKVVLGKQRTLNFDAALDPNSILLHLLNHNPRGYLFSLPLKEHTFLGVSPELLLRKNGREIFTNPLAGSVKRSGQEKHEAWQAKALLGSVKDRHEHKLVVDDIARLLRPLCHELHVPNGPSILKTDAMLHLSTEIAGQLKQENLLSLDVAMAIHPTPAVCGFPTDHAYDFIKHYEGERGYFAGLVGWCDEAGNGEWYIAIRCAAVKTNQATLFAGAGVVAGSDPTMEWQETEAKMGTMLKALQATPPVLEVKHAGQI